MSQLPVSTVFDHVRHTFLQSLSDSHLSRVKDCTSADALITNVRDLALISQNKQRGRKYVSALQKLSNVLKPYLRVIDLLVNSHPEYASLVWGAINLVLQLASNYTSFFEKLNKSLDRISKTFPAYLELEIIVKERKLCLSSVVVASLGRIYHDIFTFLQDVVGVFAKPDGRRRKTPVLLGSLAFRSFDTRFEDIIEDLKYHKECLSLEIDVLTLRITSDEAERRRQGHAQLLTAQSLQSQNVVEGLDLTRNAIGDIKKDLHDLAREATLSKAFNWISAPNYASDLEDAIKHREDGTGNWIFEDQSFIDWHASELQPTITNDPDHADTRTLWIHGAPGSGKSVLAGTIIEDLLEDYSSDPATNPLVVYHFFKDSSGCTDSTIAFRSMLAQMLYRSRNNDDLVNKFSFAMAEGSSGQNIATSRELLDLFRLCLYDFENICIVLDGIDECSDPEQLLEKLADEKYDTCVKLLFLSRFNVGPLLRSISEENRLSMRNNGVTSDIEQYSRRKIETMQKRRLLGDDVSVQQLTEHLVRGAGHMFLWARLMMMFLKSPVLTSKQRSKILISIDLPEGLDPMYMRILSLIAQETDMEIQFATTIFTWLVTARRPLKESELREVMKQNKANAENDEEDDFSRPEDFRHAVVMSCAGLVEPSSASHGASSQEHSFQFIHLSAKNFITSLQERLIDLPTKLQPYLHSKMVSNMYLAIICLHYVAWKVPQKPMSGEIQQDGNINIWSTKVPLGSYATAWWIEHLAEVENPYQTNDDISSQRRAGLFAILKTLLSRPLSIMAWMEASYVTQGSSIENTLHMSRVAKLLNWCEVVHAQSLQHGDQEACRVIETCRIFCNDLVRLNQAMGTSLDKSPRLVWDEVSAFVPSRFWLTSKSTSVVSLNPVANVTRAQSHEALVTISESSLSLNLVAVLSIWPTRKFEEFWNNISRTISLRELHSRCDGWIARFEIFSVSTESPQKVFERTVDLPYQEVWLALHQSLRKEATGNWRFHFPMAISENLQSFIILRTLYLARPLQEDGTMIDLKISSMQLELDVMLGLKGQWWELLRQPPDGPAIIEKGGPQDTGTFYTYKFTFDPSGRFAYFTDFNQFQRSTLAILSIDDKKGANVLSTMTAPQEWDEDKVAFHPTEPLFFVYRNRMVRLWQYQQENTAPELVVFYNPRCGYHDGLQEMVVSSCGKYLVMSFPGRPPVLKPVPLISGAISYTSDNLVTTKLMTSSVDKNTMIGAGAVLRGLDIGLSDDGSYSTLEITPKPCSVDVNKWTADCSQKAQIQQKLVTLPASHVNERTRISVRWPSAKEKQVKIVMDQAPRKYYSHSTAKDSRAGPTVILRDVRVLAPPVSRTLISSSSNSPMARKRSSAAIEDGSGHLQVELNPRPTSPREHALASWSATLTVDHTRPRSKSAAPPERPTL